MQQRQQEQFNSSKTSKTPCKHNLRYQKTKVPECAKTEDNHGG